LARKTESKSTKAKTKAIKTKKVEKAEKGERYYCEVCGCEIVCTKPSEAAVVCCEEPMVLILE
jgi:predicted SprT family Zn-dependent metalloprotease